MTIISLHLPKTAGTSFGTALATHFGEHYRSDYDDQAISKPVHQRVSEATAAGLRIAESGLGSVECVHGHFLPAKYLPLHSRQKLTFVTWMREPVARLFSHYDYWQQSYDPQASAPHHRKVIEEGWTLEQFCLSEQFRNLYTQYLQGFPPDHFDFIGISENYEEDLREFSRRYLSGVLEPRRCNTTKNSRPRQVLDSASMEKIGNFHAADVLLYRQALQRRATRQDGHAGREHEMAAAPAVKQP